MAIICDRGTGIYRPVFSSRWMMGRRFVRVNMLDELNPVLGEVLKIYDR